MSSTPRPRQDAPRGAHDTGSAGDDAPRDGELKQSLDNRHVVMIALGGIIGAGLFVGSGVVINESGPAAVLSYALSGVLMIFVIRAIGEMAVARPSTGSIADYTRLGLGNWAGFTVGWLYWYFWVVVAAIEAVAGAGILVAYVPLPGWLLCLLLMILLTGLNLLSVKAYGEAEFWFASIKVVAIIFFIAVAVVFLSGLMGDSPGVSNVTEEGGWFPNGFGAAIIGSVTVLFSMGGAEIATIAAAESKDPAKNAERATKQVMYRVFLFYVLSVLLIVMVLPWDTDFAGAQIESPFAAVLDEIGIPGTGAIMKVIVLTAVLSCLNSCFYITSRMLFALAAKGDAPQALVKVNRRGVPVVAILAGSSAGFICVIFNYFFPEQVFAFLINTTGAVSLMYYILMVSAEIGLRRRLQRDDPGALRLKMWAFPAVSVLAIAWMVGVLGYMAYEPSTRSQLLLSVATLAVILVAYQVRKRRGGPEKDPDPMHMDNRLHDQTEVGV